MIRRKLLQLTLRFSLLLLAITTSLLLFSLVFPITAILSIPTTWPFLFIFGWDETEEMYGKYGELIRAWFCAIPTCIIYGLIIARKKLNKAAP